MRGSNGELFLAGFNRNFGGHDWADLYTINMKTNTSRMLKKIDNKHVLCKYEASFRYGGGWFAHQPSMGITLLATERNVHIDTNKLNYLNSILDYNYNISICFYP